jgi:hypothetical protein
MVPMRVERWLRIVSATLIMLLGPFALAAFPQGAPGPSVDVTTGWVGFADDGVVSESLIGGAVRWYVSPRITIGPEVGYIKGTGHSHLVLTGNVTWDVAAPSGGRFTPFLVAGAGLFETRQRFPSNTFTSREGAFTAGGGVRVRTSTRVTVGVDARVGWELHLRVAGFASVRLGR